MSEGRLIEWEAFDEALTACRLCPRLVAWREEVAQTKRRAYRDQTYWGKPVTGFGDRQGRVLVVGLAPGAHGSNRTGRVFTGDSSGEFLFRALHRAGFANQPNATHAEDGLALHNLYITAVCHCAPPDNKPTAQEIETCLPFLRQELDWMPQLQGVVVLGKIAFDYTLRLLRERQSENKALQERLAFGHNQLHTFDTPGRIGWMLCSYHPSRQNTQTGRLTEPMFDEVWARAQSLLK